MLFFSGTSFIHKNVLFLCRFSSVVSCLFCIVDINHFDLQCYILSSLFIHDFIRVVFFYTHTHTLYRAQYTQHTTSNILLSFPVGFTLNNCESIYQKIKPTTALTHKKRKANKKTKEFCVFTFLYSGFYECKTQTHAPKPGMGKEERKKRRRRSPNNVKIWESRKENDKKYVKYAFRWCKTDYIEGKSFSLFHFTFCIE